MDAELVSCAYSRVVWHMLCEVGREATMTAERYADGEVSDEVAQAAQRKVQSLLGKDGAASPYSMVAWALLAAVVRDIIGSPFRPAVADPSWLTPTVAALARGVYEDRAFDRLPVLADALQDAGCEDLELLAHCRGPGPHARGCWVSDMLLGRGRLGPNHGLHLTP